MTDKTIIDSNKSLIHQYLKEALDNKNFDILMELFAEDCVIHRPEVPHPIVGVENFHAFITFSLTNIFSSIETEIHEIVADEQCVACRLSHKANFCDDVDYPTPMGIVQAGGKTVEWDAMGMCRIVNGKIVEEWIRKDEAAILRQLGLFS